MRRFLTIRLTLWGALLALLGVAYGQFDPEPPPPASPREFHEQEFARLRAALSAPPPGSPLTETQADFDVLHYDLTLDLRGYYARTISGAVTILARSLSAELDTLILDLCDSLTVDSAVAADVPLAFSQSNNQLVIALDRAYGAEELVTARVVYHGTPCQTNYFQSFYFVDRSAGGRIIPTVGTLSEPYGARDWWPSKNVPDDKADSARISIIVADTLTATSNGVLEAVTPIPDSALCYTWVERYPISTYLISVTATNFTHYREWYVNAAGDSLPIDHYPYPERLSRAQESWNVIPAMMTFLESRFGPYPFWLEKYGHTMFSFAGAMEHQCNTSYGRNITTGTHTYDYIVLHELAHQWFGDQVTLATWPDIWLNEGFASYSEALWFEHLGGFEALREYMTSPNGVNVVDPSGPVYNPEDLFSSNSVYDKGAWILHMLRGVVRNDSLFFAALNHYREQHAYGNATTAQFLAEVSEVIGYSVHPFLEPFLYLTNRPHFEAALVSGIVDGQPHTVARLWQVQIDPNTVFPARLDLRFASDVDTAHVLILNTDREERYHFDLGFTPDDLIVDPDDWVLKEVTYLDPPLTILTPELARPFVGEPYADTLLAAAGVGELRWVISTGQLPPGLTLFDNGVISGIPEETGHFDLRLGVEDQASGVDKAWFHFDVAPPLAPPVPLTAYRTEENALELRWPAVADADSYRVYRSRTVDFANPRLLITTAATVFHDTLAPGAADSLVWRFYYVTSVAGE